MNETNLLKETLDDLRRNNKLECDVLWVGNIKEFAISWNEFKRIANIEYDSGFGGQEIASDLIIVGKDFWFTRGEYDGSEWWDYHSYPKKPILSKSFNNVRGKLWQIFRI